MTHEQQASWPLAPTETDYYPGAQPGAFPPSNLNPVGPPVYQVNVIQPMVGGYPRKLNAALYLLVTIILGYLGVHRFLRGQIGIGLLYLLTGGLAGIGWIIDIICSIVWATQADPQGEITFVNKKYVPYQVISFPATYNQPPQTLR